MIYEIFVEDIPLEVLIGLHEAERNCSQILLCNISLTVSMDKDYDEISNTVNYYELTQMLQATASVTKFMLLESLADLLLDKIMSQDYVIAAKIKLSKPKIMSSLGAGICGICVERSK